MLSPKILSAAATICFLFAFAAPTVALTLGEDSTSNDVVLEPVDAGYATLEDGELVLEFAALNDHAETTFAEVFTVEVGENVDDVEAIWIDHDIEGVTFYADGAAITNDSRLALTAGDTETVGVTVDTRMVQETTETFTITVQYTETETDPNQSGGTSGSVSPTIEGTNLTVSPTTLETGETTTVNATYRNLGETEAITPRLTVDGTVVDQQSITLEPGETRTVSFERQMEWPGTYDVGIAGVGTESVTVEGPPIDIVDATIDDGELTAGESTAIRATVRNPTDTAVDRTLEVAIDGIVVDSRAVTIPANGERTVVFERQFDEAGTYEIDVSGVDAGTVTVDERPTLSIRNRELSAATTAAIAPPATAGLLFLAMAANRRWAFVR
ncbi:CARDB domain-containing protein [Natrinema versiforme]|uniref:CARDB domain-containing protein n=1 Tax=Natrinema versiforme JCM 10478 TaxID=1227496 RepID=L9Y747_9EURY|nr:CARDB domain-containing protein [Natrinema versiforme]ELY68753.1 hypothetical protein C489_06618 [Natrinema versiforme JCM 10478]